MKGQEKITRVIEIMTWFDDMRSRLCICGSAGQDAEIQMIQEVMDR